MFQQTTRKLPPCQILLIFVYMPALENHYSGRAWLGSGQKTTLTWEWTSEFRSFLWFEGGEWGTWGISLGQEGWADRTRHCSPSPHDALKIDEQCLKKGQRECEKVLQLKRAWMGNLEHDCNVDVKWYPSLVYHACHVLHVQYLNIQTLFGHFWGLSFYRLQTSSEVVIHNMK